MAIETYRIKTCLGKLTPWGSDLPFLSKDEKDELDNIGYSGKNNKGEKTSRVAFLNSLNKGEFEVEQTKWDNGDFCEEFIIIHVV